MLDFKSRPYGQNSLTKELIISSGSHIGYQRHKCRSEVWTFIEGIGEVIVDGEIKAVKRGDVVIIPAGMKHAVKGITELHIIEVQIGDEPVEEDSENIEWNWN